MNTLPRTYVDKFKGGLQVPVDKVFRNACLRFSEVLDLSDVLYSETEIGEQDFKNTIQRWIANGIDKD